MSRLVRATALAALALAGAASFAATPAPSASASASAPAGDSLKLIHDRLRSAPVLKGEFEQTRTLKGFRNALVSKGEFVVARGQGVWWHTREPFETTLVVTRTRLFTRNPDGGTGNLMDAQAEPGWTLTLTPRDPGIAKFLARATLAGERDVQSVRLEETRGDTTQIRFSHQVPATALAPDEAARFQ
ncbi:MAG: outer membrane lipoprotein carrier protein LolA [Burkholderiales bacterium]|nr:outer membrane lipoprotein carrier protein LolA [Burkholderiales bacterium]